MTPKADLWLYMQPHKYLLPPAIHKGKGTDMVIHINTYIHTHPTKKTSLNKEIKYT